MNLMRGSGKMNNKGFTLVELLATLVILGIISSIVVVGLVIDFRETKGKTEDIFISTIEDAMDIYLNSDGKKLSFSTYACTISKSHGNVNVYKATGSTIDSVINSSYNPLTEKDLVNPANEEVTCNKYAPITVYRDDDYVYYYKIEKSGFSCLKTTGYITNLPSGSGC